MLLSYSAWTLTCCCCSCNSRIRFLAASVELRSSLSPFCSNPKWLPLFISSLLMLGLYLDTEAVSLRCCRCCCPVLPVRRDLTSLCRNCAAGPNRGVSPGCICFCCSFVLLELLSLQIDSVLSRKKLKELSHSLLQELLQLLVPLAALLVLAELLLLEML